MREILFRAKRVDNGEWIDGYYCQFGWTGQVKDYIIPSYASACTPIEIDPSTLSQFTGLVDKNGVRIFENDIVRHGYTCKYSNGNTSDFYNNMPVSFSNNYGGWIVGNYNILTTKNIQKYSIEVIGNVFDNPELLRESD